MGSSQTLWPVVSARVAVTVLSSMAESSSFTGMFRKSAFCTILSDRRPDCDAHATVEIARPFQIAQTQQVVH